MVQRQEANVLAADRARRALGRILDGLGWGPRETPSIVLHQTPALRLRAYGGTGPAVLLVPAPIKRAYIWDLAPGRSVVARLKGAGCRVYLLDWQDPADGSATLADYADRRLGECVAAIEADCGRTPVVVGHSLGGTLAAIFATLHPRRVGALVLVGTPLHFDPAAHVLVSLVLALWPRGVVVDRVPGSVLTALTLAAAPLTVGCAAWLDRLLAVADAEHAVTLQRVERWALDEMAMSGALAAELVQSLYRDNAFVRGTLRIEGRHADPRRLAAPVLALADPCCALAPPASVEPFLRAVSSSDVGLLRYHGDVGVLLQHVGVLVGRSAHRWLWPQVAQWIRARG